MASQGSGSVWYQREIQLKEYSAGCHLIGDEVFPKMPELKKIKIGLAHVLRLHEQWHGAHDVFYCCLIDDHNQDESLGYDSIDISIFDHQSAYVKHTTASIILMENWDGEVRVDMAMVLDKLCPESLPYRHSYEGPDDMPGHAKAALMGSSVTIPITDGKLNTGTWQGLWLCEHRRHGGRRNLVVTLQGCTS